MAGVMRGVIHHLILTVRDPEKSFGFYDAVLSALGYRLKRKSDFLWNLESPLGTHSIGLVRASENGDPYSPGLHHVAWTVESRAAVDLMHNVVRRIDATVLDAPADYPQYNSGKGYYAVSLPIPMDSSWSVCTRPQVGRSRRTHAIPWVRTAGRIAR